MMWKAPKVYLTPEIHEKILDHLRKGLFRTSACSFAGVNYYTMAKWLERGQREKSGKYHDFAKAVQDIERQLEGSLLSRVFEAAIKGDDKAAVQYLQRRFPSRWREHPTLEPIISDETLSLSDKARAVGELMIRGELPIELARTAASTLLTIAQVIDLDEIAAEVRKLSNSHKDYPTIEEDHDDKPK